MSETSDVTKWLKFHTGAPVIADSSICSFAVIGDGRAAARAGSFRVRQQRISGPFDHAGRAGREPAEGPGFELQGARDRRYGLRCGPRSSPPICSSGLPSTPRCFPRGIDVVLVADDSIVAILGPRGSPQRETEACMSPSREASAPSRTRIGCWRMSRRGDPAVAEVTLDQISGQLGSLRSIA